MERLHLAIDGMSCGHCVKAVTGALQRLPGVAIEQVAIGSAVVTFDPARTSADQIVDAVNDEGYSAQRGSAA
jgi:copper chaperone